ncbi:MAG: DoxX family protein [Spirochaetes bacterium]|nr:DoxX family protein [Spirochaetota bacterium]
MIQRIVATNADWTGLILRIALGVMIFPHGAQKFLGWFGGGGFKGSMGYLTSHQGLPTLVAFIVIMAEFFGALMLVAGVGTRIAALGVGAVMAGAMLKVHASNGFFMNWAGKQTGEGIEFFILALGIALALIVAGGGKFSIDALISNR